MNNLADKAGTSNRHLVWVPAAVILLAVAFQLQTTLNLGTTPIRVSFADLLSPFLAIAVLISAFRAPTELPQWRLPHLWLWLAGLTAVLTIALFVGRFHTGTWMQWAVLNKFAGWFVLLWYFLLGGWLVMQSGFAVVEKFVPLVRSGLLADQRVQPRRLWRFFAALCRPSGRRRISSSIRLYGQSKCVRISDGDGACTSATVYESA